MVFAALGVWIAARQMLIADDKLRLDSFGRQYERRVAVYEVTRGILEQVFRGNIISEADRRSYGLRALDAQFLFDQNIDKYLRDIQHHIEALRYAESRTNCTIGDAERVSFANIAQSHLEWITNQGDESTGIGARFAPFLVQVAPARPWLLRWP